MSNADKQTGIEVKLVGNDGNAFAILGACFKAIRMSDLDPDEKNALKEAFESEAMSGDYDHLLQTAMIYFEVV